MKNILLTFFFSIISLFSFQIVSAHPGRTDASGCHTCRTNCSKWGLDAGEYHCHNAKALPQPKEPVKSHYSETGGYTEPAPEYKALKVQPTKTVQPIASSSLTKVDLKEESETTGPIATTAVVSGAGYGIYRLVKAISK